MKRGWRRGVAAVVAACLWIMCCPAIVKAASLDPYGNEILEYFTSGDYEYCTLEDGTISIYRYYGNAANVVIPSEIDGKKVSDVGARSFFGSLSLKSVTIPEGVTSIGSEAFRMSGLLTELSLPESLKSIGMYAFSECGNLTNFIIPDGVTSIGTSAFAGCDGLTNIIIPSSVEKVGYEAFIYCRNLEEAIFQDGVKAIGYGAFRGCYSLTNVSIPNSVTEIRGDAFLDTPWLATKREENPLVIVNNILIDGYTAEGNIIISDGITGISSHAFSMCKGITGITIPDSVTSIEEMTFEYCRNLTSITIPDSITSIEQYAFDSCTNLSSIIIPASVTNIHRNAFYWCKNLTIYGYEGTTAETYANENDIPFVAIENANDTTPAPTTYGDLDNSGDVGLLDVILLNKNLLGLTQLTEQGRANADVNLDGAVDSTDSLYILQSTVSLVTLPVQ